MAKSLVVHLKRDHHDVRIDRETPWGNPIVLHDPKDDEERAAVLAAYKTWVLTSVNPRAQWVRKHVHELRGKVLGCWCAPRPCHGDVLVELSNRWPLAVIGAGARNWTDRELVYEKLDRLLARRGPFILVEGTAAGADRICGTWAKKNKAAGVGHEPVPAEWRVHAQGWCPGVWCIEGKDHCIGAGFRRNQVMVDRALELGVEQYVLAFKDHFGRGPSGGTEDLVRRAGAVGIPGVKVHHPGC